MQNFSAQSYLIFILIYTHKRRDFFQMRRTPRKIYVEKDRVDLISIHVILLR